MCHSTVEKMKIRLGISLSADSCEENEDQVVLWEWRIQYACD